MPRALALEARHLIAQKLLGLDGGAGLHRTVGLDGCVADGGAETHLALGGDPGQRVDEGGNLDAAHLLVGDALHHRPAGALSGPFERDVPKVPRAAMVRLIHLVAVAQRARLEHAPHRPHALRVDFDAKVLAQAPLLRTRRVLGAHDLIYLGEAHVRLDGGLAYHLLEHLWASLLNGLAGQDAEELERHLAAARVRLRAGEDARPVGARDGKAGEVARKPLRDRRPCGRLAALFDGRSPRDGPVLAARARAADLLEACLVASARVEASHRVVHQRHAVVGAHAVFGRGLDVSRALGELTVDRGYGDAAEAGVLAVAGELEFRHTQLVRNEPVQLGRREHARRRAIDLQPRPSCRVHDRGAVAEPELAKTAGDAVALGPRPCAPLECRVIERIAEHLAPARRLCAQHDVEHHHLNARRGPADSRVEALEVDERAFEAGARECERAAEAPHAAAPPRLDRGRRAHQLAVLGPRPAGGGRLVRERELTVGDEEDGFAVVRAASDRRRREEVQQRLAHDVPPRLRELHLFSAS